MVTETEKWENLFGPIRLEQSEVSINTPISIPTYTLDSLDILTSDYTIKQEIKKRWQIASEKNPKLRPGEKFRFIAKPDFFHVLNLDMGLTDYGVFVATNSAAREDMEYAAYLQEMGVKLYNDMFAYFGNPVGNVAIVESSDGKIGLITGRGEYYTSVLYEFLGLNGVRIVEMGAGIIMPNNERIELTHLDNREEVKEFLRKEGLLKIMKEEPKSFMISLLLPEFPNHNPKRLREIYNRIKEKFELNFLHAKISFDDYSIDIFNPKSDKGEAIKVYAEKDDINLESVAIGGDSKGDYSGYKVIGENNGLVCYVGLDESFAEELKKEFPNVYITQEKRSSGVVEIINYLLSN